MVLAPAAKEDLKALSYRIRKEAHWRLEELEQDPFPEGAVELQGYAHAYRIRFHQEAFRILYKAYPKSRKIIVGAIGPRATVYSGIKRP